MSGRHALSILRGAALVVLLLSVLVVVVRQTNLVDRSFIFFPERELAGTPAAYGLSFEDVSFAAADGVSLHGWFIPGRTGVTWLWFHGNAGNISNRLDNLALLHDRLGVNIFIFDYRGYGRSEGRASEKGIYMDAVAALSHLRTRDDIDHSKIVLFGRSLGSAVAVEVAAGRETYAVILESPFTSTRAMARRLIPLLPVGLLITTRLDSLAKIDKVRAPLLVLHGDADQTVPIELGRELFDAANEPKRFHVIEGADHNDTYLVGGDGYFEALRRFIDDLSGGGLATDRDRDSGGTGIAPQLGSSYTGPTRS